MRTMTVGPSGLIVVAAVMIFFFAPSDREAEALGIRLMIEDQLVAADVHPMIDSGRVLVPIRLIAEELGLTVSWHAADSAVSLTGKAETIDLMIGAASAAVNGRAVTLDANPRIVNGRMFVPLRFISEIMGFPVRWEPVGRTVYVGSTDSGLAAGELSFQDQNMKGEAIGAGSALDLAQVTFGASRAVIEAAWGVPDRRDHGFYDMEWWIYQPAPGQYLRVGFHHDGLGAVYAHGRSWSYGDVTIATTPEQAVERLNIATTSHIRLAAGAVTYDCSGGAGPGSSSHGRLPVLADGERMVVMYIDQFDDRVAGALVMDKETFFTTNPVRMHNGCVFRYPAAMSFPREKASSDAALAAAQAGEARSLLDLVNLQREMRGIPTLVWNEAAAAAAAVHSRDMDKNIFFSHHSPQTGSPTDRVRTAGLAHCGAGENIARGYEDAVAAHHALMNSAGHRVNMLDPRYQTFGSAVAGAYYTENYVLCGSRR